VLKVVKGPSSLDFILGSYSLLKIKYIYFELNLVIVRTGLLKYYRAVDYLDIFVYYLAIEVSPLFGSGFGINQWPWAYGRSRSQN
jgi:hypothetical protein